VVALAWGFVALLWLARDIVFVAFLAVLFGALLSLLVEPLRRLRVPRHVAAVLALAVLALAAVLLVRLSLPALREQWSRLVSELPRAVEDARLWFEAQYGRMENSMDSSLLDRELEAQARPLVRRLLSGAVPIVSSAAGLIAGALIVVFGGFYLVAEAGRLHRGALELLPQRHRQSASEATQAVATTLRRWLLGSAINMVAVGVATGIGLFALGVPGALVLGIIAGLLEFIPVFGPVLASVPAIAVAWLVSPGTALGVALLYVVVQQVESNLLTPLVMKGAVNIPPAFSLLFQVFMGVLFGFIGLLVAVPILAVVIVLVNTLYKPRLPQEDAAPTG
jgi:predicted PurR-regulated permease PerM